MQSFDVLVAGAGATGLTTAIALAREGRSVGIVGKLDTANTGRTVALMDGSLRLIQALGLGPRLEPHCCPLNVMRLVDDTGSLLRTPPVDFVATEVGLPAFGKNIENAVLIAELAAAARDMPNISLIEDLISDFKYSEESVEITTKSGEVLQGLLLVAADGRMSPARAAAGISVKTTPYAQTALTLLTTHTRAHENVSTEFHTRAGPCTLVPLPSQPGKPHRASLVWMMSPREARRRHALSDAALALEIERQLHSLVGTMTVDSDRGLYPMSSMRVAALTATRLALVGDAAHGFPPIGAQGLNLGLRDVAHLVDCLERASDPGAPQGLATYAARRRADIDTRTVGVDTLNRALLDHSPMMDALRGMGLMALASIGPLRRLAMRQGIMPDGKLQGPIPRLMRGASDSVAAA